MRGRLTFGDHQASFGYCYGISVAMHMPKGLHFMIGIDRDQALPVCPEEVSRMVADLHLFAVHANEAATRLHFLDVPEPGDSPNLTPRELECLRWTMEGKTAWELGRILGIAEQTTVRHLHNASRKLGCVNKHQAVLKALRLKIIW